jgi:hypothetical protein
MNVVTSFEYVENLLHDFLDAVPFEAKDPHGKMQPENLWSPRLATILQEICSQIDSSCRHELDRSNVAPLSGRNHDINDYRHHFGSWLSARKLVFWQDENGQAVGLQPFKDWDCNQRPPEWWSDYNKVKHDRIKHKKLATLKNCVDALAGLFFVIMRFAGMNVQIRQMVAASNWWHITGAQFGEISENNDTEIWRNMGTYNIIETKLLSFPLGWWHDDMPRKHLLQSGGKVQWWGGFALINEPGAVSGSNRWKFFFDTWFENYKSGFTQVTPYKPLIVV